MLKITAKEKQTQTARRRTVQVGRRPGNSLAREEILDAAEEAFAEGGYAGTSVRAIARRASVNQALVHHYFGSKAGLLRAIFLRRGQELARERFQLLDLLEHRSSPPALEEIVRAYLMPAFNMKRRGAGGVAFLRLQAQLQGDQSPSSRKLRTAVHQASMLRFVAALQRARRDLDAKAVFWRLVFMAGAFHYTISDSHRLDVLAPGICNPKDPDEALDHLIPFLVAGMNAPQTGKSGSRKRSS